MIKQEYLEFIFREGNNMRKYRVIFLCILLCAGCAATEKVKPPVEEGITITQNHRPVEMSEEQVNRVKDYEYRKVDGEEEKPVLERTILLFKNDGEIVPISIQEVYQLILHSRNQLYQIITVYNYLVDRLVEIHEHPDLGIDLKEIPEKASIHWFIPFK